MDRWCWQTERINRKNLGSRKERGRTREKERETPGAGQPGSRQPGRLEGSRKSRTYRMKER